MAKNKNSRKFFITGLLVVLSLIVLQSSFLRRPTVSEAAFLEDVIEDIKAELSARFKTIKKYLEEDPSRQKDVKELTEVRDKLVPIADDIQSARNDIKTYLREVRETVHSPARENQINIAIDQLETKSKDLEDALNKLYGRDQFLKDVTYKLQVALNQTKLWLKISRTNLKRWRSGLVPLDKFFLIIEFPGLYEGFAEGLEKLLTESQYKDYLKKEVETFCRNNPLLYFDGLCQLMGGKPKEGGQCVTNDVNEQLIMLFTKDRIVVGGGNVPTINTGDLASLIKKKVDEKISAEEKYQFLTRVHFFLNYLLFSCSKCYEAQKALAESERKSPSAYPGEAGFCNGVDQAFADVSPLLTKYINLRIDQSSPTAPASPPPPIPL